MHCNGPPEWLVGTAVVLVVAVVVGWDCRMCGYGFGCRSAYRCANVVGVEW